MTETQIAILVVGALVLLGGVWWVWAQRRRQALRSHYGPEYDRMVDKLGSRAKAEDELARRRQRVEKLELRPLPADERTHFGRAWAGLQARFVDDPRAAVTEAHRLLVEVMKARGFPEEDLEQRRADLSAELPQVVDHYREALAIADRNRQGSASTEDLRQALVHYRVLFQALLEGGEPADLGPGEMRKRAGA
jgi:hypothetical protein